MKALLVLFSDLHHWMLLCAQSVILGWEWNDTCCMRFRRFGAAARIWLR